jgi:capsular exopolysaccharide synthesis family protein
MSDSTVGAPGAPRLASQDESRAAFQDLLATLRARWWLVTGAVALAVGLTLFLSFNQEPVYRAEAAVLVAPLPEPDGRAGSLNMATEAELVGSEVVAQRAIEILDAPSDVGPLSEALSVDTPRDTEILVIRYEHANATEAQLRAQAFAAAYLEYREGVAARGFLRRMRVFEDEIEILRERLDEIHRELVDAEGLEAATLQSEAVTLQTRIVEREVSLRALDDEPFVGSVVQPAGLPTRPVRPNHPQNGALGLFGGLILGVALAFVRDWTDDRVRTRAEIEDVLEAPLLAPVPRISRRSRQGEAPLVLPRSSSGAAEAYRALAIKVMSAAKEESAHSLLVTAVHTGDGSTTTAANLGYFLARMGHRAVVVAADPGASRVHEFFGIDPEPGLREALTNKRRISEVTRPTRLKTLKIVPAGAEREVGEDDIELLGSSMMQHVLEELESTSDIILIDTAALLQRSDVLLLAPIVNNVLLVAGPGGVTRASLSASRERVEQAGGKLLGCVANKLEREVPRLYS